MSVTIADPDDDCPTWGNPSLRLAMEAIRKEAVENYKASLKRSLEALIAEADGFIETYAANGERASYWTGRKIAYCHGLKWLEEDE
jgi:hypothetical protein